MIAKMNPARYRATFPSLFLHESGDDRGVGGAGGLDEEVSGLVEGVPSDEARILGTNQVGRLEKSISKPVLS